MKQISLLTILFIFIACSGSKKARRVQEKPPGFIGRFIQNTTSRYNAFYNSEQLYNKSMIAGQNGFQEQYDTLLPPSIQDALAESGSAASNMDAIIQKTATMIEKKPYAKWVDDHFLLNGIAQYVKGDYDMAERIFRYTSSEYQYGVNTDRVKVRQKQRGINEAKQRKKEAQERLKEKKEEKKKREDDEEKKIKDREAKVEKAKKRQKALSRDEQYKAKKRAKEQGRDVSTEDIVKEIKERNKIDVKDTSIKVSKLSDEERNTIKNAPTLVNKKKGAKENRFGHHLAAKDALLWLAKTYITQENFVAAQSVLTAINEDEFFPNRLDMDYYLTYADMHLRLNNYPKAAEYVQLALDEAPRRQKGRLAYLLGQIYADSDQWELANEAFKSVKKFHPYYDYIYHAKKEVLAHALESGQFSESALTDELKKMTRDAKNDDFMDEVYYYLGKSYAEQNNNEQALKAYEKSLEMNTKSGHEKEKTYIALGDSYYQNKAFPKAEEAYGQALNLMSEEDVDYQYIDILNASLKSINTSLRTIKVQDSLLAIAALPQDEQLKLVTKLANKELRKRYQSKMSEANKNYGEIQNLNAINDNNNNRPRGSGFAFYDIQQSVLGYNEFKKEWGNRPNVDNWRRSAYLQNNNKKNEIKPENDQPKLVLEDDLIAEYMKAIPNSPEQQAQAITAINEAYINLGQEFIQSLGDNELGSFYLNQLLDRPNNAQYVEAAQNLLKNKSYPKNSASQQRNDANSLDNLYKETYDAYAAGDYQEAAKLASSEKINQNNKIADKFAFILAMSKGHMEGQEVLNNELLTFIKRYPNSPLVARANQIINK